MNYAWTIDIYPTARYRGDKNLPLLPFPFRISFLRGQSVFEIADRTDIPSIHLSQSSQIIHPDTVRSLVRGVIVARLSERCHSTDCPRFPRIYIYIRIYIYMYIYTCLGERSYKLKERAGPRVKTIRFILAATLSRDDQNIIVLCTPCLVELSPWNSKYM